ncbi:MAG: hypothetical protein CL681_11095 [Blastopirellula sp.]|nr:hypothetical protein [Blastopirellula sp.]
MWPSAGLLSHLLFLSREQAANFGPEAEPARPVKQLRATFLRQGQNDDSTKMEKDPAHGEQG